MKHRLLSFLLALTICIHVLTPITFASSVNPQTATQREITDAILTLQEEYPEGMVWTNTSQASAYVWMFPGSIVAMSGCAALAATLQDQVFGTIKEVPVTWQRINKDCPTPGIAENAVPYSWEKLWPGDIVKFSGHTVLVLQKLDDRIAVVEGNYGGKVHWGRIILRENVELADYVFTRFDKTEPLMPFLDMPSPGHWSCAAIAWAIRNDVAAPVSATHFAPKQKCARAEIIFFLWAASGRPEPELTALPFTDIPEAAFYRTAVLWALEQGITSGTTKTTFSPDRTCTRSEAMTFLWRTVGSPAASADAPAFADVENRSYYYSSVAWAAEQHVTGGTSETTFSPNRTVTRAEALTFLYLVLGAE